MAIELLEDFKSFLENPFSFPKIDLPEEVINTRQQTGPSKRLKVEPLELDMPPIFKETERIGAPADPVRRFFDRSQIQHIQRVGADGKLQPLLWNSEKLEAGDYEIQFNNGRAFRIHVPPGGGKDLPVMFVIPGVSNNEQDPRGYIPDVNMHAEADKGDQKFIVVTALTEKHKIGRDSSVDAWAWNLPGALIHPEDVKAHSEKVGYDDRDYFEGVMDLIPQLTEGTRDHGAWGFTAGSQGAAALHRLASDDRFKDKIQNIYVAGGTMEAGGEEMGFNDGYKVEPYDIKGKNGKRVIIVDTAGDTLLLPHKENLPPNWLYEIAKRVKIRGMGLDAVDPRHQNPEKQEWVYLHLNDGNRVKVFRRLGDSREYTVKAFISCQNEKEFKTDVDMDSELLTEKDVENARRQKKDIRWVYIDKVRGTTVDVYELPTARHIIPGPREGSTSTDKENKYQGFYSAATFARDLRRVSQELKKGKQIERALQ